MQRYTFPLYRRIYTNEPFVCDMCRLFSVPLHPMKGNEQKPHIGIFGRRNYGKSALVNYLTGQQIAIVSSHAGTTTDPVRKSMEISGIGPVVWIDTAGLDDEGQVGELRVNRSRETLAQVDLALILFTDNRFDDYESDLVSSCRRRNIPFILIYSQSDRHVPDKHFIDEIERKYSLSVFLFNVYNDALREPLLQAIRSTLPETSYHHASLLADVVRPDDTVVMVTPIDSSAPEGRMILPQVQVLRDLLDNHTRAVVCRETELDGTLQQLVAPPRLVITDSQVFSMVATIVPETVYLTSFSIVLARAKGLFNHYAKGTPAIAQLRDGDRVLMLESCTHNVTCEDIGRVKLPQRLQQFTHASLLCETVSGFSELTRPVTDYSLVIQCGGCVATPQQLRARLQPAIEAGVPVSNYGMALAYLAGIYDRAMQIFHDNAAKAVV